MQQRESLGSEFTDDIAETCQLASRPIEARNKPKPHWIGANKEHNRDASGRSFSRESIRRPGCDDNSYSKLDQISRQPWQPVGLVSRPAIFHQKIPAFNVAILVQTQPEAGQPGGVGLW